MYMLDDSAVSDSLWPDASLVCLLDFITPIFLNRLAGGIDNAERRLECWREPGCTDQDIEVMFATICSHDSAWCHSLYVGEYRFDVRLDEGLEVAISRCNSPAPWCPFGYYKIFQLLMSRSNAPDRSVSEMPSYGILGVMTCSSLW